MCYFNQLPSRHSTRQRIDKGLTKDRSATGAGMILNSYRIIIAKPSRRKGFTPCVGRPSGNPRALRRAQHMTGGRKISAARPTDGLGM
jgi:hypothetical protein